MGKRLDLHLQAPALGDEGYRGPPPPALSPEVHCPYLLKVHPARIAVLDGRVVHQAARIPLKRGINQIDLRRDGQWLIRNTIRSAEDQGWTVIMWDVDGPGTSYLHQPIPGCWLSRWERAVSGSSDTISDLPGYVDWLVGLRLRGVVPELSAWSLGRLRERLRKEVQEHRDAIRLVPSRAQDLDRAEADLRAVELAISQATASGGLLSGEPSTPAVQG